MESVWCFPHCPLDLLGLPLLEEIISEIKIFRLEHLLASQRAGVLKPVSVGEKSKLIGSNNVWQEDRKLTKLLLSRTGKPERSPRRKRALLLDT